MLHSGEKAVPDSEGAPGRAWCHVLPADFPRRFSDSHLPRTQW